MAGGNGVHVGPASMREKFARSLGPADLFYPDRRIESLSEREIEVLNKAASLREHAERVGEFAHGADGFGHWNAPGHKLVGELPAVKLCETTRAGR